MSDHTGGEVRLTKYGLTHHSRGDVHFRFWTLQGGEECKMNARQATETTHVILSGTSSTQLTLRESMIFGMPLAVTVKHFEGFNLGSYLLKLDRVKSLST